MLPTEYANCPHGVSKASNIDNSTFFGYGAPNESGIDSTSKEIFHMAIALKRTIALKTAAFVSILGLGTYLMTELVLFDFGTKIRLVTAFIYMLFSAAIAGAAADSIGTPNMLSVRIGKVLVLCFLAISAVGVILGIIIGFTSELFIGDFLFIGATTSAIISATAVRTAQIPEATLPEVEHRTGSSTDSPT